MEYFLDKNACSGYIEITGKFGIGSCRKIPLMSGGMGEVRIFGRIEAVIVTLFTMQA
jgi:hypothetical protein